MELYSSNNDYKLYHGNMLDMLEVIENNTIDSIVTDPPYELNFMSKGWDNAGVSFQVDTWKKCYEVLKPGGYLLAFGGSRTFHRIACAIEDAGFEIRDTIMWLYGSGFPKSMNIGLAIDKKNGVESIVVGKSKSGSTSKAFNDYQYRIDNGIYSTSGEYQIKEAQNKWNGWGTALKPSFEPIIVARKPFKGSLVDNVIEYGVGGINIDECRVKFSNNEPDNRVGKIDVQKGAKKNPWGAKSDYDNTTYKSNGRFPANTILTYDETDFDEVCGGFPNTKGFYRPNCKDKSYNQSSNIHLGGGNVSSQYNDSGSASRYFYNAKASKRDRDEGLPNKWLDNLELILYNNIGDELWKDKITIKEENKAKHLEDMVASLQKVIEEYGIQTKKDIDLNTLLYGKKSLEKYLKENKYTTKMEINSTTVSQILNLLTLYTTKENTQDAKLETENGTNHVEIVENTNQLEIIIKENQELVLGANNVVLKMLLKINEKEGRNEHCTVKPTNLMQYLIRLVTPNNGIILDPFNGSGSTGKAVMYENKERNKNYKYIGIELTEEYLPISKARIEYVCKLVEEEKNKERQMSIYDL